MDWLEEQFERWFDATGEDESHKSIARAAYMAGARRGWWILTEERPPRPGQVCAVAYAELGCKGMFFARAGEGEWLQTETGPRLVLEKFGITHYHPIPEHPAE